MTIPSFDENGNLPPGVHWATWDEFKQRFGVTLRRSRMIEGLKQAMEALKASGCRRIYVNGSFVTDKLNPGDFDACWDSETVDFRLLRMLAPTLLDMNDKRRGQKAQYGGEFFQSDWIVDEAGKTALDLFQTDKQQQRKGIIAIDLQRWEP